MENETGTQSFIACGEVMDITVSTAPMTPTDDSGPSNITTPLSDLGNVYSAPLEYESVRKIWKYCPPIILVLGTVGSCMTLLILNKSDTGSSAVLVYFKALAVSDLCLLYSGLLRSWITFCFSFEIRDTFSVVCKIHIWVVYVTGMTSSWLLVAMTSQRAVSIVWPHQIKMFCTKKSANLTVVGIVTFCALLNAHILYGYTLRDSHCDYLDLDYEDFKTRLWPWVDLTFTSLLPFLLLMVSNTMLVCKVAASVREIKRLASAANMQNVVNRRKKHSTSLTLTLICLSALFFLLTSPLCVYLVADFYFELDSNPQYTASAQLGWAVTNNLWYCNSAINFYLYCLSGSRFRQRVLHCLCCATRNTERAPAGDWSLRTISGSVAPPGRVVSQGDAMSEF